MIKMNRYMEISKGKEYKYLLIGYRLFYNGL